MLGCAGINVTTGLRTIKMVMVDSEENKLQLLGEFLQMKFQKDIYAEEELVPSKRGRMSASKDKGSLGEFV